MDPVLIFIHGPLAGRRIPVDRNELTFGRDAQSDIVLDDPLVSRLHALVTRRGNAVLIEDLGSNNGTILRDERLHSIRQLHHGDTILLGTSSIRFEEGFVTDDATQVTLRPVPQVELPTPRELDVLRFVAAGLSSKQIGEQMHLGERTVKLHLSKVYRKLDVTNRSAAVITAMRRGLIRLPAGANGNEQPRTRR